MAEATRGAYDEVVQAEGLDPITTEVAPGGHDLLPAEEYHQGYLAKKNPNGCDCHASTGVALCLRATPSPGFPLDSQAIVTIVDAQVPPERD